MEISLEISTEAAQALHHLIPATDSSIELQKIARDMGVELNPMHPGIKDPDLIKNYFVETPTENRAKQVIDAFLKCAAVEGAFIKPEGEQP